MLQVNLQFQPISISSETQTFNITVTDDSVAEFDTIYHIRLVSTDDVWHGRILKTQM